MLDKLATFTDFNRCMELNILIKIARFRGVSSAEEANVTPVVLSFIAASLLILGFFVVFSTILAVAQFGSSLPIWDQWRDFRYTRQFIEGNFQFGELFNQHNEHRIFFPRLIFLMDYIVSNSNNTVNFVANIIIVIFTSAMLMSLWRKLENNLTSYLCVSSVAVILLFSLSQHENFLWGFQVQFFGAISAAVAVFFVFSVSVERARQGRASLGYRYLAYLLALLAAYTLSNGILAAFLLIPMAVVLRVGRTVILTTALWAVLLAFSYFRNFHPITGHSPYIYSLAHPVEYLGYVSAYLGNLMGCLSTEETTRIRWSTLLGGVGLALTLVALARTLRNRDEPPARIALLAVILFVLGTALLTALGRITFGVGQAFASRYLTPVSVFWVAQIFYWASIRRMGSPLGIGVGLVGITMLAILTLCGIKGQLQGWNEAAGHAPTVTLARDALLSDVLDEASYRLLYPVNEPIVQNLPFMREHHLAMFAAADNRLLGQKPGWLSAASAAQCTGAIDVLEMLSAANGEASFAVNGWAWDLTDGKAVGRVIFVDGAGTIVGYASGGWPRVDVSAAVPAVRSTETGWKGFLKVGLARPVKAYGLLPGQRVCEIAEKVTPQNRFRFVPLAAMGASIPIQAAPSLSGGWAKDGQNPASGPVPDGEVVYGSWGGADSNVGDLRIGPFTADQPRIAFPIVTGPHSENQTILLLDATTGVELERYPLMLTTMWTALEIDIPDTAQGKAVILVFRDQGPNWGEWSAVGSLHEVVPAKP